MKSNASTAVLESGLAEEVTNLGNTLYSEIDKSASEIWKKVYEGKTEVTHKALSPLKTLYDKLIGLSFVEPHVAPVADIIQTALKRVSPKGNINGADLLMLQGLVCLLKDTDNLVIHSQKLLNGYGPATVLDALLENANSSVPLSGQSENEGAIAMPSVRELEAGLPELPGLEPGVHIPSMGLW